MSRDYVRAYEDGVTATYAPCNVCDEDTGYVCSTCGVRVCPSPGCRRAHLAVPHTVEYFTKMLHDELLRVLTAQPVVRNYEDYDWSKAPLFQQVIKQAAAQWVKDGMDRLEFKFTMDKETRSVLMEISGPPEIMARLSPCFGHDPEFAKTVDVTVTLEAEQ